MWFNSIYFIPPTEAGCSGEVSSLKSKNYRLDKQEPSLGSCNTPITGPKP